MDRRSFLRRVGRGGAGAALLAAPGGFVAGELRATRSIRSGLSPRVAASGARGHARVWWSAETEDRVVALTFDDGPTPDLTPRVLDVLARYEAPATFFAFGQMIERRPDLLGSAHETGHEIGNHTYHHVSAEEMGRDEVLESVERGANAIAEVIGHRPRWYRPVKGHVTGSALRAAARLGHDVAIWSLSRGPRSLADGDRDGVEAHLRAKVHPGAIVMLHDGLGRSPLERFGPDERLVARRGAELDALPGVIESWLADGYRLVTLSELVDEHDQPVAGEEGADGEDDLLDVVDAVVEHDTVLEAVPDAAEGAVAPATGLD